MTSNYRCNTCQYEFQKESDGCSPPDKDMSCPVCNSSEVEFTGETISFGNFFKGFMRPG
jgi:rubredoxin